MKLTSTPCPCGHPGCRHVIIQPYCVRLWKDDADNLIKAVNGYEEMKERAEKAESALRVAEAMRPHWAKGYSSDGVAAQTTAAALNEFWKLLKANNQTEAVGNLERLGADFRAAYCQPGHIAHPVTIDIVYNMISE